MARKIRLTPLQRDILRTLEEAGAETRTTVLATLRPPGKNDFTSALAVLARLGYVHQIEQEKTMTVLLTPLGRLALTA